MSLTLPLHTVDADAPPPSGTAPVDPPRPSESECALCRLPRPEHGVHLLHRFVRSGQPLVAW